MNRLIFRPPGDGPETRKPPVVRHQGPSRTHAILRTLTTRERADFTAGREAQESPPAAIASTALATRLPKESPSPVRTWTVAPRTADRIMLAVSLALAALTIAAKLAHVL